MIQDILLGDQVEVLVPEWLLLVVVVWLLVVVVELLALLCCHSKSIRFCSLTFAEWRLKDFDILINADKIKLLISYQQVSRKTLPWCWASKNQDISVVAAVNNQE